MFGKLWNVESVICEDLQNLALQKDLYIREDFGFSIVNKKFCIEIHPEYLIWAVDQSERRKTIATNPMGITNGLDSYPNPKPSG